MANTSKNGYEIRSDLLGLAKELVEFNFQAKVKEYEYSIGKDGEQVVQSFKAPTYSADDIINVAKKFNDFVTSGDMVKSYQENFEKMQEEAKKRDHKKLGKELGLFIFSELVGPGLPIYTFKGAIIRK